MASNRRVYRVKHSLWKQDEISYPTLLAILRSLGTSLANFKTDDRRSVIQWVDELDKQGVLKELVDRLLTPYQPTRIHRWWNSYWIRRKQIARPLTDHMQASEVAQVFVDFFLLNGRWLIGLWSTRLGSASPFRRTLTLGEAIWTWTRFSTTMPEGTTSIFGDLPTSLPKK